MLPQRAHQNVRGGRAQLSDNPLHPISIEWGKRAALFDVRGHSVPEVSLTRIQKRKIILEVLAFRNKKAARIGYD